MTAEQRGRNGDAVGGGTSGVVLKQREGPWGAFQS